MRNKGFTLIELLIVIAIVAILAGAMVPMFRVNQLNAQQARVRADMDSIKTACMMYNQDTGQWPAAGDVTDVGLVTTDGAGGWRGPYMDEARTTPWGDPYHLVDTGAAPNIRLTLWSYGEGDAVGGAADTSFEDISLIITPDRDPENN